MLEEIWKAGLKSEISFWDQIISGAHPNEDWCADFVARASGTQQLQDSLAKYIEDVNPEKLRILDVGSGPHTILGPIFNGRRLNITAVDPLASSYNESMTEAGISPAVPTLQGEGEKLSALFPERSFHLVHSRNAIDHSYDPPRVFREMLHVCKPGGVIYVCGSVNEAVHEAYHGLHQWNFLPVNNDLIIWRPGVAQSLRAALSGYASFNATGESWYACEIVKSF